MAELLLNQVIFDSAQPSATGRENGDLWVNASTLNIYAWDANPDDDGVTPIGWVGITSSQNQGSIVYIGDSAPILGDIYPNLVGYDPIDLGGQVNPLPGTLWFDSLNHALKIYYVDGQTANDGEWVAVTSAHYMTQSVAKEIGVLRATVANLQLEIDALKGNAGG